MLEAVEEPHDGQRPLGPLHRATSLRGRLQTTASSARRYVSVAVYSQSSSLRTAINREAIMKCTDKGGTENQLD